MNFSKGHRYLMLHGWEADFDKSASNLCDEWSETFCRQWRGSLTMSSINAIRATSVLRRA